MNMYRIPTLISFLIIFTTILSAQTVTVLPSIKDNSMFSESGSESLGAGKLFTGQTCQGNNRRALIEFDLSGIPVDAVVTSVTLNLGAENSGNNGDGVIEVFGVTKEWGEGFSSGSGNGGPAVAPDATWTDAMFGTEFWDTPGGDFDSAVLSSRFTNENDQVITFPTSSNFVARAQAWVNDPADNHGIIIIGVETATCTAYRFGARDIGTAPELVVTWETSCDPPIEWVIDETVCEDDDFTLNGIVYDQSNPSGTQVFTAANGCDSTIIISLSFIQNSTALIEETLCPGDQITINGTLYDINNPSGIEELLNFNGCDSIVTIDLSFFPDAVGEETYAGCANDGYSVVVNGTLYDESQPSGVEIFLGASVNGCDSMVNIDLFFQAISQENITHSGCEGNGFSVVVDGITYNEMNPSGSVFLVSSNGCDSIINIDLFFAPTPNPGMPAMMGEVCNENDPILDLNSLLSGADAGGVWTETSPNPSTGLSGNLFDGTGQNPATYFFRYTVSAVNCPDEFTQVMVNVQTPLTATVTTSAVICNNNDGGNSSMFDFNSLITGGFADGVWFDEDASGVDLTNLSNVDFAGVAERSFTFTYATSVIGNCPEERYPVTILVEDCTCPSVTTNENYTGCEGDNFAVTVNGVEYNQANPTGTEMMIDQFGCDSIIIIELIFNAPAMSEATFSTCDLSTPATTTEVIANGAINGCDSIITITTVYLPNDETAIAATSCDPDDAGVMTETFTNQFGCDSIVTTTTTTLPVINTDEFLTSCDPNDVGVTTLTLTSFNTGCDSIVTITVTLMEGDNINVSAASCDPDDAGVMTETFTNQFGCDSTVTTVTEFIPLDNSVTVSDAMVVATIFGATYQWIDCDNNDAPIMGETDRFFTALVSGNYAVEIMQDGCTITSECVMVTVVNTEEAWFADQIDVLPNPTSGAIWLTFGELENVNVRIMEVTGKVVLERTNLGGGSADLFLEGPAGLYFVGVEVDGEWGWMKVVKN